jgi:acyl-CoA hydrolase
MTPKKIRDSQVIMRYEAIPPDANPVGNVHGGTIMKLIDAAAGVVAKRHCRKNVVTARVDNLQFLSPVYIGNLITVKASLNYTGRTSMEIGVRVESEDLITGKITHTNSSYVTMVAIDEKGKPASIPQVIPETEEEKRRYREGEERSLKRKQERKSKEEV